MSDGELALIVPPSDLRKKEEWMRKIAELTSGRVLPARRVRRRSDARVSRRKEVESVSCSGPWDFEEEEDI